MIDGCIFCAIVSGQTSAAIVSREPHAVAFLDHRPLFKGHVLVVPADHVSVLGDFSPGSLGPFFSTVQRIARAVEDGLGAHGSFIAMNNRISQSVPHVHAHVVPRRRKDGMRGFFWPREAYADDAEMASFAGRIADALPPVPSLVK